MRLLSPLIVCLLLVLPRPGHATVLQGLDLDTALNRSQHVALVTVRSVSSHWVGQRLYTRASLEVERGYHGGARAGHRLEVWALGGTVGGVTQRVVGEVTFRPGERAVIFATPRAGRLFVTGMVQGKLRVAPGAAGAAAPVVWPGGGGATLVGPRRVLVVPEPLARFEGRLVDAIRRVRGGAR
jgi:hypothetical protein